MLFSCRWIFEVFPVLRHGKTPHGTNPTQNIISFRSRQIKNNLSKRHQLIARAFFSSCPFPGQSWLAERQTIFSLINHLISNKLESTVFQRANSHLMREKAICFQIRGNHLYCDRDSTVGIDLKRCNFRINGIISKIESVIVGLNLAPGIVIPISMVLGQKT